MKQIWVNNGWGLCGILAAWSSGFTFVLTTEKNASSIAMQCKLKVGRRSINRINCSQKPGYLVTGSAVHSLQLRHPAVCKSSTITRIKLQLCKRNWGLCNQHMFCDDDTPYLQVERCAHKMTSDTPNFKRSYVKNRTPSVIKTHVT
jgi:hypothetical protein